MIARDEGNEGFRMSVRADTARCAGGDKELDLGETGDDEFEGRRFGEGVHSSFCTSALEQQQKYTYSSACWRTKKTR